MIVVRYADDAVLGFEQRADADAFLEQLQERMQKFGLELNTEKTRLIEFGRFAGSNRKRRREGKPETFDFLGFTHICGKTTKGNWFTVRRRTIKKRLRSKLQDIRQELRKRWHERIADTGKWLRSVVQGYFNYHAVPGNFDALQTFRREVARSWLRRYGVVVNGIALPGSGSARSSTATCLCRRFCIQNQGRVLTPNTRGRSRMR